uniref:Macrophage erythroblast attacher n=1 Tax=Rhodosorus marinus TaxID=101924 RepID=A0A7S3EIE9_9RHOD|mmetsp:Transcript_35086/g.139289  ORF Transcript_35086/g.139289 Transcript_35086/m.139289 type:complete len:411 (+) Transcript_35086:340-1572(+)|eukprot:CAMPEP_0113959898 /NCGR_PEP_ID=MMETSP0011_2-20120614/4405_1 /TAXON_ID=101924 /ORGANISM="Rhodosorus marinus" /LENGTH=410 /DNA_ID=CAMNT_0000971271 /DNA_START=985 /DNA_END=2217 /DNA_ORIENTATION=- /assembly_acc=CAM_ASM_000156
MESEIEYSLLKVPLEDAMRQFRTVKKEVDRRLEDVSLGLEKHEGVSVDQVSEAISGATAKLKELQSYVEKANEEEREALSRLVLRFNHLAQRKELDEMKLVKSDFNNESQAKFTAERQSVVPTRVKDIDNLWTWNEARAKRFIADFMLRSGYTESAQELVETFMLQDLVDEKVIRDSRMLATTLERKDCTEAIKWSCENRKRLEKIGSDLLLRLRVQEFVELRRSGKITEAIEYARAHMAPIAEDAMNLVPKVMGLLAFPPDTKCSPYAELYAEERWSELIHIFQSSFFELHGLTTKPLIEVAMMIGMSARKTKACFQDETKNIDCPTCSKPFNEMSSQLPFCQNTHSKLICSITGKVMNENNPPLVLGNGNVYSETGLNSISHDGTVIDPRTGESFPYPSALIAKAYVM